MHLSDVEHDESLDLSSALQCHLIHATLLDLLHNT